ncbi:MAG TPA: hypothetical protein VMG40_02245 [Bryobacteraceae bacterium]|nr:hypothetical protein [Bryobacteraceae bacterium]
MIEFALYSALMIPLLLWTFLAGFNLVRFNECQEIDRDIANQYIHGVDFSTYEAQQVAQRLASGFNMQIGSSFTGNEANNSSNTGGNVYVVLSEVMYIGAGTCGTANPCTNENKYVFIQQIGFGTQAIGTNSANVTSKLGSLTATTSSSGIVQNILTDTGAVCTNCSGYFQTALTDGQTAYVVEAFFSDPNLSFSSLPGGVLYTATFM